MPESNLAPETPAPAAEPRPAKIAAALRALDWRGRLLDAFLVALIAVGIYFRFSWVNWNEDANLHPDEYGLTNTITRLSFPKTLDEWFNTRLSPISPYIKYDAAGQKVSDGPDNRLRWGQWPIIIIRWAAEASGNTDYGKLRLLGRHLSALADTLSLLVAYFMFRRLYGHRIALLAVALSALAVMQIQQSHFMTVDNFGVFFSTLAMYCAVRVATPTLHPPPSANQETATSSHARAEGGGKGRGWGWYAAFGVAFGMAVASRINLLPLFGLLGVAALVAYADELKKEAGDLFRVAPDIALRLALAGVVALVTFRVTHPMAFRAETGDTTFFTVHPNPDWAASMGVAQNESNGIGAGPPGEQWTRRTALVFPFVNMVLWGMGLPLGLMGWGGLAWAAWRSFRTDDWRKHLLPLTWAGGYFLFMGTRWVKSIRYFLPIYPFIALFAAWALVELWRKSQVRSPESEVGGAASRRWTLDTGHRTIPALLFALVTLGTLAWAWGFIGIYRRDNTRLQASRWIYQNIPAPFNLHIETADGIYTEPLPGSGITQVSADVPITVNFIARVDGAAAGFTVGYAHPAQSTGALRVVLATDGSGQHVLAATNVPVNSESSDPRGGTFTAAFDPVEIKQGQTYYLLITAPSGGPIAVAGSTVSNENWDEGLPLPIDGRDGFGGLYRGLEMEVRWPDDQHKREMFFENLALVDYIILPSQRAIWSASRLPLAYPMTMEYYRALFDGRLGFDLVAQFQSPIQFGPLQISDVGGSVAWGRAPTLPLFNDSLLAAEEAFSVYDHAPVWIFMKRADFDLAQARAVLEAIDLTTVVNQGPRDASRTPPTLLMLPLDRLAAQRAGGTWSEMFNADGWLNTNQPLGVAVWWLAVLVMGWAAFPLTYLAFNGLPDRGYPLAKSVALLVVAWLVWMLGSYHILPFTRATVALGFGALAVVSGVVVWLRRAEFREYLRTHWRYMLVVEGITLALLAFDLLIRLGNPDLWHPNFGGEKPMDFSYFNAVLKSTSFPPYDPWLAGGYINYYYYGFVIVGLLVKLLGIVPAFAYNLILPTLFALLGINAFCVAFNLVSGQKSKVGSEKSEMGSPVSEVPRQESGAAVAPAEDRAAAFGNTYTPTRLHAPTLPHSHTPPNAYLAGIAAALLIVVLGNLGQVKTVLAGWGQAADHAALSTSFVGDNGFTATLNGAWRVMSGQTPMPVRTGDWYWTATRIIPPGEGEAGPITEFPFFTFLYADLHAHMIDLPFTVLALAWAVAYLKGARGKRSRLESSAMWLVGGLAFGVSRPTNTWDFPVYLALGIVAVVAAQWLRDEKLSRENLWGAGWRVALLVGLAVVFYQPFARWYGSGYNSVKAWEGGKTPLDAYLFIHGLFLFILVTFLVWETRRWLAETPASILAEASDWGPAAIFVALALIGCVAAFLYLKIAVGLIALPLMVWAGLLMLRSSARMPDEKRVVFFLLGTGLALTLVVELVVLEGDVARMNTVFKFYLQVWTLFSIAAAAALAWVWAELPHWKPARSGGWTAGLALLVACASLYTATATAAKVRDRFPQFTASPNSGCQPLPDVPMPYANNQSLAPDDQPHSLNGMDYLQWSAYCDNTYFLPLSYDYEAIRWMQDNVKGSPVIVEGHAIEYRLGSRYTVNTGLPSVIGWNWHERQQRAALPDEFVWERVREVAAFFCGGATLTQEQIDRYPACADALRYSDLGVDWALVFLRKYDVRYVIVGPLEQAYYPSDGLAKFDTMVSRGLLTVVYQNSGVTIYEVQGP